MGSTLCKLNLVYPSSAEEALLDMLEEIEPPLPGFTTWKCAGHGDGFEHASQSECVRGRADCRVLCIILDEMRSRSILEAIKEKTPIARLMFWIEPVSAAGKLL